MQSGQPNVLCRLSHSLGLPRHIFPMKNEKKKPGIALASEWDTLAYGGCEPSMPGAALH